MARKVIKYLVIAIVAVNVAILAIVFLGKPPPPRPLPSPNGYDDFVKAGRMVTSSTNDYSNMSREELGVLISTNEEALKLVRTGLSHECRVPVEYSVEYANALPNNLSFIKKLALLMLAEGRLAELEGRTNDAIKIYLDGVRFGQECDRGGLLISKLVGIACEAIPLRALDALVDAVGAPQARKIVQALETVDSKEPPFTEVLDEEKRWSHDTFGLQGRIVALFQGKQLKQGMDRAQQKAEADTRHRRRTMVAFAERAYELEHGKRAQSIADLVPSYLKAIPKDPTTGATLDESP